MSSRQAAAPGHQSRQTCLKGVPLTKTYPIHSDPFPLTSNSPLYPVGHLSPWVPVPSPAQMEQEDNLRFGITLHAQQRNRKKHPNTGSGGRTEGHCHMRKTSGQGAALTALPWCSGISAQPLGMPLCPQDCELLGQGPCLIQLCTPVSSRCSMSESHQWHLKGPIRNQ